MDGQHNKRQRVLEDAVSGEKGIKFGLSACQFSVLASKCSVFLSLIFIYWIFCNFPSIKSQWYSLGVIFFFRSKCNKWHWFSSVYSLGLILYIDCIQDFLILTPEHCGVLTCSLANCYLGKLLLCWYSFLESILEIWAYFCVICRGFVLFKIILIFACWGLHTWKIALYTMWKWEAIFSLQNLLKFDWTTEYNEKQCSFSTMPARKSPYTSFSSIPALVPILSL